jgi:dTDP-4-amino-4,6-dideoxygalactose transaminase
MILTQNGTAPSPDNFKIAEEGLLAQTGGKLALWSGRAATAFYHAYRLAMRRRPDVQAPEIIMPAMSCTTAANVAAMMGIKPRFADIQIGTGLSRLKNIKARLSSNTIAVVAIHLFGNHIDLDAIKLWCKELNLLLIEDPTQALKTKGHRGSTGDVTLYSFNKTKIIDVGNGVLIANTDETASELEKILAEEEIPFPTISEEERSQLALNYRNMHHSLVSILKANPENAPVVSQSFLEKRPEFEALYLRPVNPNVELNRAWAGLGASLKHRRDMAKVYKKRLRPYAGMSNFIDLSMYKMGLISNLRGSTVTWRYSVLINEPNQQVALSEAVRKDGFHVSNLYWPVNQFFNPSDECPNADYLARRIINLWVDTSVDEDYVARCCESLIRHAKELLL